MCGISGVLSNKPTEFGFVKNSIETIAHRGPDEQGFFQNDLCILGMCRLSIIDVSSGQQPSYNLSQNIVSVFNGEIYNFRELRRNLYLKGHNIKSSGDAALIPFLYQEYGDNFPQLLQGMFAIAVYDISNKRLLLIRDRLGKKPLWYSQNNKSLYFSSEVKGLLSLGVVKYFNENIIPEFLRYGYINAPRSTFSNIYQLPPASILTFQNGQSRISQYWNSTEVTPTSITFEEAKNETLRLLREAVRCRLVSERPLGAFLSGGIDSTLVTALMHEISKSPVHTFSIGFSDKRFDESLFAQEVAKNIGTIHHERKINSAPVHVIEKIARTLDQPFADSSIIPTYLLSEFARERVVVALSGDGGDEGFAGYERYRVSKLLDAVNPLLMINPLKYVSPDKISNRKLAKLLKHSRFLPLRDRYRGIQSLFQTSDLVTLLNHDLIDDSAQDHFLDTWEEVETSDKIRTLQLVDLKTYLPGDLMYKVDISSMANSLEVRSPFLDYRVIEFGLSLPSKYKIKKGEGKHILREIAREIVPRKLIDRPKMGFGIPRANWLRQDLRNLVSDILLDNSSKSRGWYQFNKVEKVIKRHNEGYDLDYLIWPMLMLEIWARNWFD